MELERPLDRSDKTYTCADYREEMMLLGLLRRLQDEGLTEEERSLIQAEILSLESEIGL